MGERRCVKPPLFAALVQDTKHCLTCILMPASADAQFTSEIRRSVDLERISKLSDMGRFSRANVCGVLVGL